MTGLTSQSAPRVPSVRVDMHPMGDDDDAGRREEDEHALRRANADLRMMQQEQIDRASASDERA